MATGQEGGNSVAGVLSGKVNPSGKLTMAFPVNYSDTPSAKNWLGTPNDAPKQVSYEEGVYVGYRYFNSFNVKPSYEFAYGLSYSDFAFADLQVQPGKIAGQFNIAVTVKNTAKEVAELYLSAPAKLIDKPAAELTAFAKSKLLQPGGSQTLSMVLQPKDLTSFIESHFYLLKASKRGVACNKAGIHLFFDALQGFLAITEIICIIVEDYQPLKVARNVILSAL